MSSTRECAPWRRVGECWTTPTKLEASRENETATEGPAVAGGGEGSAPGRTFDEDHRGGGGLAESRSEADRDGYQPHREGPSRRASEERLDATLGAARVPGGTINSAGVQSSRGADNQHPTPRGGDARGVDAQRIEHPAMNDRPRGMHDPPTHPNEDDAPFLQPVDDQVETHRLLDDKKHCLQFRRVQIRPLCDS
ncbi:hypothetical protein C8R44DRAFT_729916 [Mycena epipterygia]|nr:hypothetical protein C8R44DRAFT_729916 [Mycena epipterygia]